MRIYRTPRTQRFTILPNELLEDQTLSFKARGLLAYLLSRPDGWHTDARDLATHSTDGRTAVLSGLAELEEAGYLTRTQGRDDKGQFWTQWELSDTPNRSRETCNGEPDPNTKNGTQELDPCPEDAQDTLFAGFDADGNECILSPGSETAIQTTRTRIPPDFAVTDDMVAYARQRRPDVDWRNETGRFIAYWRAKPGKAGEKTDWPRTWRTWIRQARSSNGHANGRRLAAVEPRWD